MHGPNPALPRHVGKVDEHGLVSWPLMDGLSWNLMVASAVIAVIHTALGPDHTLPFLMLSRARGWTLSRTLAVTLVCGAGHVTSSLILGAVGMGMGLGVARLEGAEAARGVMAAWVLVAFGGAYGIWGVRRALRRHAGLVAHEHEGRVHIHLHGDAEHGHPASSGSATTFWLLFMVFVLGPCEPLIPLLTLPASQGRWALAWMMGMVFTVFTLATMLVLVALASVGMKRILPGAGRWSHAIAGGVMAASGLSVLLLGL